MSGCGFLGIESRSTPGDTLKNFVTEVHDSRRAWFHTGEIPGSLKAELESYKAFSSALQANIMEYPPPPRASE